MERNIIYGMILILLFTSWPGEASYNLQIRTRYATVVYESEEQITRFNGISSVASRRYTNDGAMGNAHEEMRDKLDSAVEMVESILNIYPQRLQFEIVILSTAKEVQDIYQSRYGIRPEYIAFYAPGEKILFVSSDDIDLRILAHELTHVILSQYLSRPLPAVIQEVVARFVESRIED